ncbi:transmembrane protein, putative (macronuclear) [Tetrahymena thermophila SB210]|uniref:Transmembrane protein, putative n=1 Tax=Tetrahymena thermophila (strain SB210) TaxID=312017 RepID=Q22SH7_TETTS|nr:transmembrane protein, putative [Tetrahymena thermophila SB210]EAR87795.2 transmembrane protein, putative [Tetrahymena thermophila SB210]|eukprot:XP_001008040.2 transmembrane protein, putative [Tetrahymena thermophila SB210]
MDSNETSNLVSFSTSNGQIFTWDYSSAMQPKLLDSTYVSNYGSLKSIQFLTDNTILILSESNILAFDVLHSQILQTWKFQKPNSKMVNKFVFSLNGLSFLLYDSCFNVLDQNFKLIFKDCSLIFDDEIIQAQLDVSFYLVIQKRFSIQVFKVDLNNQQLIQKGYYQSLIQIQIWKIKSFPLNYQIDNNIIFELAIFFADKSFMIFTEQLNLIIKFLNIPLSQGIDISFVYDDPYDNLYVIGGLSSSKSALKYTAYAVFKNQSQIFYVFGQSGLNKIFPVYKYLNNNNQIQYGFKSSLVLSFLTAIQNFSFNVQNNDNFMNQIAISQQVYMSTFQMIKQQEFFTYGDSNGLMTIDATKKQYYQKVYELDSILIQNNDFIQKVYQSLQLQKYFIIKSNIMVYNLLTNEFIEQINFENSSNSAIKFFKITDSQSIICLKGNQLLVKSYLTNKVYTYSSMSYVTSYLLNNSLIYLYGSSITILDLQLTEYKKLINDADSSNFQFCQINSMVLVCKQESSLMKIFNQTDLQVISSFNQILISSFYLFQVDDYQQIIILFAENIEVYDFNGQYKLSIQSINQNIMDLQIHDHDISVLLTSSIQIFDRKSFGYRGEIQSPQGFKIINYSYIPSLNQLVFSLESIILGQIFTANLDSLTILMKFTSSYSQNQPSKAVAYQYDKDQNLFILLDEVVEYDNKSQFKVLGFDLDFQNNNLFVYTQTQIFQTCFGDLNKPVIKFRTDKKKFFSQVNQQQQSQINIIDNTFMIAGDQGLLYKYQNSAFEYYSQFNEEIQQLIYDQTSQLLIIALSQSFVIYSNFNKISLDIPNTQQNNYDTIQLNSPFLSFICNNIYITKDMQIYHYDFVNKQIIHNISLDNPNLYIRKQICSIQSNYVFLGLSNGDVIIYNRQTQYQLKITLVQQQQGQIYKNLQIGELIETSTDLWVCYPSGYGIFRIKISDLSYSQTLKFSNLKTFQQFKNLYVMIFEVDQNKNRLFLSFVGESLLRVLDFQGNIIQYISLPGLMYNKLKITQYHLLAYTTFHIMIYDRNSLVYISRIRRNNFYDFIVNIEEVAGQYLLLLTETKYEMFYINQMAFEANLMDQIQIQSAIFMSISQNNQQQPLNSQSYDQIMQVLMLSQSQVYEQRYNLKFEGNLKMDKVCTINISVESLQDITKITNDIQLVKYSDTYQRSMIPQKDSSFNNKWDISLKNTDIRNINFNGTLNSIIQVQSVQMETCSQNQICQSLQIYQDSFLTFTKQIVQIRDFNLDFQYFQGNIQFFRKSDKVIFDNIQIQYQNLTCISFQFYNMTQVVLNKIKIINNLRVPSNQIGIKNEDALFYFENTQEVYLYSLVIDNQSLQNISFYGLIGAKNVSSMTIFNLVIKNSQISVLTNIIDVGNLTINNLQIINCQSIDSNQGIYLLNIIGALNSNLSDIIIQNNINLLFIFTTNAIQENNVQKNLENDQIMAKNIQIVNNQIKYSDRESLISIKNNYSFFLNIIYQFNQGNIALSESFQLKIQDSFFQQNKCLNGGALSIYSSQGTIQLQNTTFFQNQALASGGAIYIENTNAKIFMDDKVQILHNQALIGGGLRLFNKQSNYPQQLSQFYKNQIFNNSAELYGKNFASFIQSATIGVVYNQTTDKINGNNNDNSQSQIQYNIILPEKMEIADQKKYQKILQIFKFQSGGEVSLFVKLIDSEGTYLNFQLLKFQQKSYPASIIEELNIIQFKIQPITLDQNVVISGHNIITSQNFDEKNNQFLFNQIKISSMPNQTTYLTINLNTLQSTAMLPIQLQIYMRVCLIGEVVQVIGNNIYSCYSCPSGQFSLTDPTQDQFWHYNISKQNINQQTNRYLNKTECQKCPDSTYICQNNTIILKQGYWRSNQNSSEIIQCSSIFNACNDEDKTSKYGCLRGYIGPVCRSCDINGQVWDGEQYSQSYYNQMKCNLCSTIKFNIVVISMAISLLILYFFISTSIFIDSFTHSSTCLYLRKVGMIPISRNQIKDQSSFYLKILNFYLIS